MPLVGFEPTVPVFERPKTIHALYRAAIVVGCVTMYTKFNLSRFALSEGKLAISVCSPRNVKTDGHSGCAV
jgi:hypothetical protein